MSEIHFYRRFKKWNYAKGTMLFVTITTEPRGRPFGRVVNGKVELNLLGQEVEKTLGELAIRTKGLQLFERVVMPDHVHFNVRILPGLQEPLKTLGKAIAGFKNHVIRFSKDIPGGPVLHWQQGYHDHLCLSRKKIEATARYIAYNPAKYELMHNRAAALKIKEPLASFRLDCDDYWKGIGNVGLLSEEYRFVSLRISRKCTREMVEKIVERMANAADQGFVIISGFISPGERAVRDMLAKRKAARFVRILPSTMPIDYKPESAYIDAFLENRYLEIAEGNEQIEFSRGACLELNEEIVRIARALPEHRNQADQAGDSEHRDQTDQAGGPEHRNQVGGPEHRNQAGDPEHRDQTDQAGGPEYRNQAEQAGGPEHRNQAEQSALEHRYSASPSDLSERRDRESFALYFKVGPTGELELERF